MQTETLSKLLTTSEAAEILAVSTQTLNIWRHKGLYLSWVKTGRSVKYRPEDVQQFINERTLHPTDSSERRVTPAKADQP